MTECDRPAIGAYARIVFGDVQIVEHGENLGGEGFGDLNPIEFIESDPGPGTHLPHSGNRAETGPARIDTGSGTAEDRQSRQFPFRSDFLCHDGDRSSAIADRAGVSRSDASSFNERRRHPLEEVGPHGPWPVVSIDHLVVDTGRHADQLCREAALVLGEHRPLVRAHCIVVLAATWDPTTGGKIVCGRTHVGITD